MSMNLVNPRTLLYAVCFICMHSGIVLAQQSASSGANLPCTSVINTRIVASLSVDEISKLGDAISIENDFGGLILRPFDDDDRPRSGKEIELGFILARSGDLGGTPVGLTIWSKRNLNFSFRKNSEDTLSVESSDLPNCHALATFALSGKGHVLRDGRVVAQAH